MSKRSDSYADADTDIMSGNQGGPAGLTSQAPKFSIFGSIYSHMPPPQSGAGKGGSFTIGDDDDDDDDDGIDISGFSDRLATYSSLAKRYKDRSRDSEQVGVGFADMDDSTDSDLVFDLSDKTLKVSLDDLNINTSTVNKEHGRHFSMPEKDLTPLKPQNSGRGFGLKRASTMPTSLVDMVPPEGDITKTSAIEVKKTPTTAAEAEDVKKIGKVESEPGLSRAVTVPAKLKDLKSMGGEETPATPAPAPVVTKTDSSPPYKSRILANFFGRQQPTISEENQEGIKLDQTDSPASAGPISAQADKFTAKSSWTSFAGFTQQKAKVKARDMNVWAPGGT